MEKWNELKNGGEIYEGADASDFPETPSGKEIGDYISKDWCITTEISEDNKYTYITHRFPGGAGDTGIVIRLEHPEPMPADYVKEEL